MNNRAADVDVDEDWIFTNLTFLQDEIHDIERSIQHLLELQSALRLPNPDDNNQNTVHRDLEAVRTTFVTLKLSLTENRPPAVGVVFEAYRRSRGAISALSQLLARSAKVRRPRRGPGIKAKSTPKQRKEL